MRIRVFPASVLTPEGANAFINDWYTLGAALRLPPKLLSYVLTNMRVAQNSEDVSSQLRRIKIKDRTVYDSRPALKRVQQELLNMLGPTLDSERYAHLLAYMPGKSFTEELKKFAGHKYVVKCDIRKYFDTISFQMIVNVLVARGFTPLGAKLIARYCVVPGKNSLQQGSKVSALLSNLVGYDLFDTAIQSWIAAKTEAHGVELHYVRYCDNLALFASGKKLTLDMLREFRQFVTTHMASVGFRTHAWSTTANNNPKKNQKFLGVVLNHTSRTEKTYYGRVRAALFNACTRGPIIASEVYLEKNGKLPVIEEAEYKLTGPVTLDAADERFEQFMASIAGTVQYIANINSRHGHNLKKLLLAARVLTHEWRMPQQLIHMGAQRCYHDGMQDILPRPIREVAEKNPHALEVHSMELPERIMAHLRTYKDRKVNLGAFESDLKLLIQEDLEAKRAAKEAAASPAAAKATPAAPEVVDVGVAR